MQKDQDQINQLFFTLKTTKDLADLLEISIGQLNYFAFVADHGKIYKTFDIPKKGGGERKIIAPTSPLKIIQSKLSQILQTVYCPKASVHGFVKDRSIKTNAERHIRPHGDTKYVLNIDLKDFFPSITFPRVFGLLKATPYNLPTDVAKTIANLCCFEDFLPQGAPSSPVIANMICASMDSKLLKLAKETRSIYTRYADDITFSTSLRKISSRLVLLSENTNQIEIGEDLNRIIVSNGFLVNKDKLRLESRNNRQEVTGLTINEFANVKRTYVKNIRSMIYSWKKFGLENAYLEYCSKRGINSQEHHSSYFKKVLRGKLEYLRMIRGANNPIFVNFANNYNQLDPEHPIRFNQPETSPITDIMVFTEGSSDWKHLKHALQQFQELGEFSKLNIKFYEFEDNMGMGNQSLYERCVNASESSLANISIYIFDRDDISFVKKITDSGKPYKKWSERVFSFPIPIPSHRKATPDVCIELFYKDEDLKIEDKDERRLFLSSEFHSKSCHHLSIPNCSSTDKRILSAESSGKLLVIDNLVFNSQNNNIALPKNDFARNILQKTEEFKDVDISEFRLIFNQINSIIFENHLYT